MQAIIMAAGKGTRLQALNIETSKHMLHVAPDKPILAHTLDVLPLEIDEVIFVVNHLREHIQNYFGKNYCGRKIRYVVQEELNGSGGAVWACKDLMGKEFLVINGDDIYHPTDLKNLVQCRSYGVLVYEPSESEEIKVAVVELNADNTIKRIVEYPESLKSSSRLINTGTYKLEKNFFDYPLQRKRPGDPEYGLPQTMVSLANDHLIEAVEATFWQMVNTPEDFACAKKLYPELAKQLSKDQNFLPNSSLVKPAKIF
jgi:NDP-sugar pyrophosphorylase family protein